MASQVIRMNELPWGASGQGQMPALVHPDELRTAFALAMSQMYRKEVPLYGDLIRIVQGVNQRVLENGSAGPTTTDSLERLTLERHGAIRLGKPTELRTVGRIFKVLGMQAVGYYDLSIAGLPMHATCFRPTDVSSLAANPFRVFTTLLRPELLRSDRARDLALRLLEKRQIFSDELLTMLDLAEQQDHRLSAGQAAVFIREALTTFSWAPMAEATHAEYQVLKSEHPILADIACFRTAHINHLTPRTLDIGSAQRAMCEEGMSAKDRIEGPPVRKCPILLRQTSFLALEEPIMFKCGTQTSGTLINGSHKARFGEIEERGAAVTPKGRKLYDKLLEGAMSQAQGESPASIDQLMIQSFEAFPDSWSQLRHEGLIYCKYQYGGKLLPSFTVEELEYTDLVERLVSEGVLECVPITYEDFLPFSAAGIFQSNLHGTTPSADQDSPAATPDIEGLEKALGSSIIDADQLYAEIQSMSLESSLIQLRSVIFTQ
ncbi:hypothetical protein TruAng_000014 [Truncatella angustata]|nr:hypothetical protein TruAng_000014 [Truncatella angustata]